MGEIIIPDKVRPVAGLLCSDEPMLQQLRDAIVKLLGPIAGATAPKPFTFTDYYTPEMGAGLWRQYIVFEELKAAEALPDWKIASNRMEQAFGLNDKQGRVVNIDPGYLAPGKLVLASTKDHGHRMYLRDGIYAEITMKIEKKKFVSWPWTYPDYAAVSTFFDEAYQEYLKMIRHGADGLPEPIND